MVREVTEGPKDRMYFLEESQDLQSLPSRGSTQAVTGGGPGCAPGADRAEVTGSLTTWNTYIEFFKLFLNFTIHFNSIKVWIPNRKCFNEQQGSV